jgi:hypothetical protein
MARKKKVVKVFTDDPVSKKEEPLQKAVVQEEEQVVQEEEHVAQEDALQKDAFDQEEPFQEDTIEEEPAVEEEYAFEEPLQEDAFDEEETIEEEPAFEEEHLTVAEVPFVEDTLETETIELSIDEITQPLVETYFQNFQQNNYIPGPVSVPRRRPPPFFYQPQRIQNPYQHLRKFAF